METKNRKGQLGRAYWFVCATCGLEKTVRWYGTNVAVAEAIAHLHEIGCVKNKDGWHCATCVQTQVRLSSTLLRSTKSRITSLQKEIDHRSMHVEELSSETQQQVIDWENKIIERLEAERNSIQERYDKYQQQHEKLVAIKMTLQGIAQAV